MASMDTSGEIDTDLYSRQLYAYGAEAQRALGQSNVLIAGLTGLGCEIAKNIALTGVARITLWDSEPCTLLDLSTHFFLSEKDVGQNRAAASRDGVAALNRNVEVVARAGDTELLPLIAGGDFHCVVCVNVPRDAQLAADDYCRANGIRFIGAEMYGVFGSIFCDFGPTFSVVDPDSETPPTCLVATVSAGEKARVTVLDDTRHGLEAGDVVQFSQLPDGLSSLGDATLKVLEVTSGYEFVVDCDTTELPSYQGGAYVQKSKQHVQLSFKSLRDSIAAPGEFLMSDFAKMDVPAMLHHSFQAVDEFRKKHGRLPEPASEEDAALLYEAASTRHDLASDPLVKVADGPKFKDVVKKLAGCARGALAPISAALGGIVSQEAMKACTGKFTPICQWLYFDAMEVLPADAADLAPAGDRFDGQTCVLGRELQGLLQAQTWFLVGAGAIGCEVMKNWALMGLGNVHITDMDLIEKSNLSRQFLFRPSDIGASKATAAAREAAKIQPRLKVTPHLHRVGKETETVFHDEFYDGLDGVCTALDNIEARLYMDQRCLFYRLPMLESGTLGTKGNTQVVIPHLTENYGATRDPPEKSIPVCTLKHFPNRIEHTLQWARDAFEGVYSQTIEDVNAYLSSPDFSAQLQQQQNTRLDILKRINENLVDSRPMTFEDCVAWARLRFEEYFANDIKQLLHNFPVDQVTTAGQPFWSGAKRPPVALGFDALDDVHLDFVKAASNLRAKNYGIRGRFDTSFFLAELEKVVVPAFRPRDGVKIQESDAAAAAAAAAAGEAPGSGELMDVDDECAALLGKLPTPASLAGYRLEAIEFEKDDDSHMHFITAASNLRARNYSIPEADLARSRLIAGKIIPAIATTTALVAGLICLELYKIAQKRSLESYKNAFVNLSLPLFAFSEPQAPEKNKSVVKGEDFFWTAWDCIEIAGGKAMTLEALLGVVKERYGLDMSMLSYGVSILYSFFSSKKKQRQRLPMTLLDLVQDVTKAAVSPTSKFIILEMICTDEEGEDVELPYLKVAL